MARYQVLYWRHIPLGVKAFDIEGMVRKNLPAQFQEVFQRAALQNNRHTEDPYTTSGFRWGQEHEREGSALDVATEIVNEIVQSWKHGEALANFEQQSLQESLNFLDLNR
jgi:hypothetical protein